MTTGTTTQPATLPAFKRPAMNWWARFPFMPDYLMGDLSSRYVRNRDLLAQARAEKKAAAQPPWAPDPFVARPTAPPIGVVRSPNAFKGPDIANSPGGRAIAAAGRGAASGVSALLRLLSPPAAAAAEPTSPVPAAGTVSRGAGGVARRGMEKHESLHGSVRDLLEKTAIVRKRNGKYVLLTRDGKRVLGTHGSAQDAYKQEYAIQKSKERAVKSAGLRKTAADGRLAALLGVLGAVGGGTTGYFYGDPGDPTRSKIMRMLGGAVAGGGAGALAGAGITDVARHGLFGNKVQRVKPIAPDTQIATGEIASALLPGNPAAVKNINALAAELAAGDTTAQETYDRHYDKIPEEYREGVKRYVANGGSLNTAVEVYDNLIGKFRDPKVYSVPITLDQKTLPIITTLLGADKLRSMFPTGGASGVVKLPGADELLPMIAQGKNSIGISLTKQDWMDALRAAPEKYRGLSRQIVYPGLQRPDPRPGDPNYQDFIMEKAREDARKWTAANDARLKAEQSAAEAAAWSNRFLAGDAAAGGPG